MLTSAQLAILKAAILADSELSSKPPNEDGDLEIAILLNLPATPDYFIWKDEVNVNEIMQNGFDWTRVDNATVGQARIWQLMVQTGVLYPSQANVRSGVSAAWPTAASSAMRLAIFGHFQRLATRGEKLFVVSGAGTTTTDAGIGPATTSFIGDLTRQDISAARNS